MATHQLSGGQSEKKIASETVTLWPAICISPGKWWGIVGRLAQSECCQMLISWLKTFWSFALLTAKDIEKGKPCFNPFKVGKIEHIYNNTI